MVEMPGNWCGPGGGAVLPNSTGNDCDGTWTSQGWGAGADTGAYIWITLPFVTADMGSETDVSQDWWGCGDVNAAPAHCVAAGQQYNSSTTLRYLHDSLSQTIAPGVESDSPG